MTNLKRLLVSAGMKNFVNWLEECNDNYPERQSSLIECKKMREKKKIHTL